MLNKEHIKIYKANRINSRYYLEILNKEYDIFRAFKTLDLLKEHLKKYPISENIIKDLVVV